jgi:hypothetical protein
MCGCTLTRPPVIVLQKVEEQLLGEKSWWVLCADRRIIVLFYSEEFYGPKNKIFCGNLMYCL